MTEVRAATPADVDIWRALRRDGFIRNLSAFIRAALAAHDATPIEKDAKRCANGDRFLGFQSTTETGPTGFGRHSLSHTHHCAEIRPI